MIQDTLKKPCPKKLWNYHNTTYGVKKCNKRVFISSVFAVKYIFNCLQEDKFNKAKLHIFINIFINEKKCNK